MSATKTCRKCGQTKPVDVFFRQSKSRGGGAAGQCRECVNSARRAARHAACAKKEARDGAAGDRA